MTSPRNITFDILAHDRTRAATNSAASNFDRLGSRLGSLTSKLGTLAAGLGIGLVTGLAAAGTAAAVFGIKAAASMEQSQIAFTNMLGSADKAKTFLKELQDFADVTPFEFADLAKSSQRLLAMGFTAKQILPMMTAVGDAVAGLGGGADEIQRATIALGQMNAKQKIQAEEMMQLTELGIPAYQILADKLHMTVGELQDLMSTPGGGNAVFQMAHGVDALVDGIEHGTKNFKGFSGMMEQQSTTLMGLWSTFKDKTSRALMEAFQPAMPALKKVLDFATKAIPKVFDFFKDYWKQIGDIFKGSTVPNPDPSRS